MKRETNVFAIQNEGQTRSKTPGPDKGIYLIEVKYCTGME